MQGRRLPASDPGQYKTGFAVTSLEPGQRVAPASPCASWSRSRNNPGPQGLCRARDIPCPQRLCCYGRWEDFFPGLGKSRVVFSLSEAAMKRKSAESGSIREHHRHCKHTAVSGSDSHAEELGVSDRAVELQGAEAQAAPSFPQQVTLSCKVMWVLSVVYSRPCAVEFKETGWCLNQGSKVMHTRGWSWSFWGHFLRFLCWQTCCVQS